MGRGGVGRRRGRPPRCRGTPPPAARARLLLHLAPAEPAHRSPAPRRQTRPRARRRVPDQDGRGAQARGRVGRHLERAPDGRGAGCIGQTSAPRPDGDAARHRQAPAARRPTPRRRRRRPRDTVRRPGARLGHAGRAGVPRAPPPEERAGGRRALRHDGYARRRFSGV